MIDRVAVAQSHVDLGAGVVQPNGVRVVDKFPIEVLGTGEIENGRTQIGV